MYQLSNEQVDLIDQDLIRLGLTTESVRANILDHLCILIEQEITHPDEFDQAAFSDRLAEETVAFFMAALIKNKDSERHWDIMHEPVTEHEENLSIAGTENQISIQ